jgi:hypothetical protein
MMHAETASVSHCSRLQPKISHSQFQATSWSESHSLGTRDRKDANITAWYQDVSIRHGSANQTMEMSRSFNAIFYVIYEWRFWCHACHGLLSSFSGTISLNSSRWESCVGPSWFARSNPNASNRIITSHPRPIPHIFSAPWTQKGEFPLVACPKPDSTRHIPLALAHANIKNLLILRPPPKHNYVKRTFGSFFHWCTGTVLCLLAHFIGEIGPDDGPPVPSRFNCLVCCTQVMSTHLMTGYMDCEVIRGINATYSLIYWLIHWFVE